MKEESLLLLSDLQKLINQVVLIDYTIIILEGDMMSWLIDPIISWLTILVMRSGDSIGVKGILIFFLAVLGTGIALFVGAWLSGKNNE